MYLVKWMNGFHFICESCTLLLHSLCCSDAAAADRFCMSFSSSAILSIPSTYRLPLSIFSSSTASWREELAPCQKPLLLLVICIEQKPHFVLTGPARQTEVQFVCYSTLNVSPSCSITSCLWNLTPPRYAVSMQHCYAVTKKPPWLMDELLKSIS